MSTGKVLVVLGSMDGVADRSFGNLSDIQTIQVAEINAYDVLRNDWIVFTDATLPGDTTTVPGSAETVRKAAQEAEDAAAAAAEARPGGRRQERARAPKKAAVKKTAAKKSEVVVSDDGEGDAAVEDDAVEDDAVEADAVEDDAVEDDAVEDDAVLDSDEVRQIPHPHQMRTVTTGPSHERSCPGSAPARRVGKVLRLDGQRGVRLPSSLPTPPRSRFVWRSSRPSGSGSPRSTP